MTGPLCKVCGKPVPKTTVSHNFGQKVASRRYASWIDHIEKPANRAEAQRLINGQIISVQWSWRNEPGPRYIISANVWDGESYAWGGHFHAQGCAAVFGANMADLFPEYSMPAYKRARNAQAAKASRGTIAEARATL
jgi:hypothetical protein